MIQLNIKDVLEEEGNKIYRKWIFFPLHGFAKMKESGRKLFILDLILKKRRKENNNPAEQRKYVNQQENKK